jgi:hypothetical protein
MESLMGERVCSSGRCGVEEPGPGPGRGLRPGIPDS